MVSREPSSTGFLPPVNPHLRVSRRGAQLTIVLDRPSIHNALNFQMWRDLKELLRAADAEKEIRVILLTGSGSRAFSSGSDLNEFAAMSTQDVQACFQQMEDTIDTVERIATPVIARVQGYAVGSALELVLACDCQVVATHAHFGMPIARLGIMLGPAFAFRLVRVLGPARAKELLYTGRMMDAEEAWRAGMVSRVVPSERLDEETDALIQQILSHSYASIQASKRAVQSILDSWHLPPSRADRRVPYHMHEADFREGVRAFLEKRKPNFS